MHIPLTTFREFILYSNYEKFGEVIFFFLNTMMSRTICQDEENCKRCINVVSNSDNHW
jgi:hypothetical protein